MFLQVAVRAIRNQVNSDIPRMYQETRGNSSHLAASERQRIEHAQDLSDADAVAAFDPQQVMCCGTFESSAHTI